MVISKGVGANFWAIELEGGARVRLMGLTLDAWWRDQPDAVRFEAIVASDVWMGWMPLEQGYDLPAVSRTAEVPAPQGAADPRARRFWHPEIAGQGAEVRYTEISRAIVEVELKR